MVRVPPLERRVWCASPGGEGLVRVPLLEGRVWCALSMGHDQVCPPQEGLVCPLHGSGVPSSGRSGVPCLGKGLVCISILSSKFVGIACLQA